MRKICYILRGLPSSGKTALAKQLAGENVACADDYFYEIGEGKYAFDKTQLYQAHLYCEVKFKTMCLEGVETIALANTNTKPSEFKRYMDIAKENGYIVFVIVVEKYHEEQNSHDVPIETIDRMEVNLKNSIKLR